MLDEAVVHFVDKMGVELLFVIGILVIFAYLVIKMIPIFKDIRVTQIKSREDIEMAQIKQENEREMRKSEEFKKEDERDRARTEVLAKQNEIISSLCQNNEAMTIQMASLASSLESSKSRSIANEKVLERTYNMVSDIHNKIIHKE